MRKVRIVIGVMLWLAAAGGLGWCYSSSAPTSRAVTRDLYRFSVGRSVAVPLAHDGITLHARDPIFALHDSTPRQIGEVVIRRDGTAAALLYANCDAGHVAELSLYRTPDSMEWVVRTMLPAEKRQQIAAAISQAFQDHHQEIIAALRPIVEDSLRESFAVVEQDLAASLARHRVELETLGSRYQRDIVEKEIVPLVRSEIWPIVRRHAQPEVENVGRELWQRVSLWRFGWRYLYDKTPLPDQAMTRREWNRFVTNDASPVLEAHLDDFVAIQQKILADVSQNEEVRSAVRKNLSQIIDDPELQQIVWHIVRETIIDNPRLREVLDRHWSSPEAQAAFHLAADRLEPTVRKIGALLFGTEDQISPEFAAVLRNQVLHKDKRWLLLTATSSEPRAGNIAVRDGGEPTMIPFLSVGSRTTE